MNMVEKKIFVPLLFLAFGLFFLGFTIIGFVLAICVAMFLGTTTGCKRIQIPREFPVPDGNWSVVCKEARVPVIYSSLASDKVMRFMAGYSHEIELKQEDTLQPSKSFSVYGHWTDPAGYQQYSKLGHIPHQYTEELFRKLNNGSDCVVSAKVSRAFVPARQKTFSGLAVDIAVLEPSPGACSRASSSIGRMPFAEPKMSIETTSLVNGTIS